MHSYSVVVVAMAICDIHQYRRCYATVFMGVALTALKKYLTKNAVFRSSWVVSVTSPCYQVFV